jgi:hypothetical protein
MRNSADGAASRSSELAQCMCCTFVSPFVFHWGVHPKLGLLVMAICILIGKRGDGMSCRMLVRI